MGNDKTDPKPGPGTPDTSTVLLIFSTIIDTTWRLFVPVIAGGLVGLWLDFANNTKPWSLLAGTILGALIAILLVRQQYKRIKKEDQSV